MEKLVLTSSLALSPISPPPFPRPLLPLPPRFSRKFSVSALKSHSQLPSLFSKNVLQSFKFQGFASVSSSGTNKSTLTGTVAAPPVPPSSSYIGTPLFWVGIGVALSALFSVVVSKLKQYAMQQALKTMMNPAGSPQGSSPFRNPPFPGGSPFPFPPMPPQGTPTPFNFPPPPPPPVHQTTQSPVNGDVSQTKAEPPPTAKTEEEEETNHNKYAFVDVSPEEKQVVNPPEPETYANRTLEPEILDSTNGAAFKTSSSGSSHQSESQYQSQPRSSEFFTVDTLEKMMEDPTVQQMVYPYLPEELRNPETFKWMLKNPQYRQQLQDMLNNMGGNSEWDRQMMESLKNFDMNSPQMKEQFDQLGVQPEEVMKKIMANPDVAMAFQNPRVQAAIMDCSQNPLNITKYQNDKEVMDVFTKIAELFPNVSG